MVMTTRTLVKSISDITPDMFSSGQTVDVQVGYTIHPNVDLIKAMDLINAHNAAAATSSSSPEDEVNEDSSENESSSTAQLSTTKWQTTDGFFVCFSDTKNADDSVDTYIFDKSKSFLEKVTTQSNTIDSKYGELASKLRVGKNSNDLNDRINDYLNGIGAKLDKYTFVDKFGRFDILLDKETFVLNIDLQSEIVPITNEIIGKLKSQDREIQKLKLEAVQASSGYNMGDRVMLYGPTGTGKTYDFLSSVEKMQQEGKITRVAKVTVSDGFEDIDFLARIVPTPTGIRYNENEIVDVFRQAAAGEKVAILIDELNRGNKSFLNMMLTLLDPVNGSTYSLNNFINDEIIEVPMENVFFMATMNLGWKYTGTNSLDEALFDRFNIVQYKGYNEAVEDSMLKTFDSHAKNVKEIISSIRNLAEAGQIRAPISTRGIKVWAEMFLNSAKTAEDVYNTFAYCMLNRLISVDDYGNPNKNEIATILQKFKEKGFFKVS